MVVMHKMCEMTGLLVEPEKDVGPATRITVLGLELDYEVLAASPE